MKLEKDTAHFVVLVIALFSFMFGMGFATCINLERSHADVSINHF